MPITYSQAYYDAYLHLPEDLAAQYTHKRLDNHCYLRIALDNTVGAKWDTQVQRPAYKNITPEQRK